MDRSCSNFKFFKPYLAYSYKGVSNHAIVPYDDSFIPGHAEYDNRSVAMLAG